MFVLVTVFWLWLLLGSANFIAGLFDTPFYAMLALYGLGVVTLISLGVAGMAIFYMVVNKPARVEQPSGSSARPGISARQGISELAPVIRMVPRRVADHSAALTNKAAAKWRDLAS